MVYALESLVGHYGPLEESSKALGIGYLRLGETTKAQRFLLEALRGTPQDPDILRAFFKIRLVEENFEEAVQVGRALINAAEAVPAEEDIAGLALALVGLGKTSEARDLLEAHPGLDRANPLVKRAIRGATRGERQSIRSLLSRFVPLNRVLGRQPKEHQSASTDRRHPGGLPGEDLAQRGQRPLDKYKLDSSRSSAMPAWATKRFPALLEYWVYAHGPDAPKWESIRDCFARLYADSDQRRQALTELESMLEKKDLTVDHISRRSAKKLFDYPEDLLPRNSKELNEADRATLKDAQIITRVRLVPADTSSPDYLVFMVRLVEAVRQDTEGVVQDAVSHTLWGSEQWTRRIADTSFDGILESHIHFEVLDEGGGIWIHSHGMQKFGLPEIEIDGIPPGFASSGLRMMFMVAETLLAAANKGALDFRSPLSIENTPFLFNTAISPRDDEEHFPIGSLRILPYLSDYDPHCPNAVKHVLKIFVSKFAGHKRLGKRGWPPSESRSDLEKTGNARQSSREAMLAAHRKARSELVDFRKSFQERGGSEGHIHAVKVGFPANGGQHEWMWVALDAWRGDSIVGYLENSPTLRQDLQKGCRVMISEGEIFDWVIMDSGSIVKGAYTEIGASPNQNHVVRPDDCDTR
jgi:uncharacterized protein YegJ (DUF2314 family)/tetratricopeptide (TPR) repeat protein